jgi:hypothetical protein
MFHTDVKGFPLLLPLCAKDGFAIVCHHSYSIVVVFILLSIQIVPETGHVFLLRIKK